MDGPFEFYFEDGQLKEKGTFKNGKKDGLGVSWYLNGQKDKEINYKDDKVDGLWVEWYRDGQKMYQKNCNDDGLFCNKKTKEQIEETLKKFDIDDFIIENYHNEFEYSYELFLKEDVYQIFKKRLSSKN